MVSISGSSNKLVSLRKQIFDDYAAKTPKSAAHTERASRVLAAGVTGGRRFFEPHPLYMTNGMGSRTYDLDGNEYIDCFLCNGPLLLGHRHPDVMASRKELENTGSILFNPDFMVECAELLQTLVPAAELIRFLGSGSEAVLSAVRLARSFTGKNKIVKFFGHYHGQDDQFLIGRALSTEIISNGVPAEAVANTVVIEYSDIEVVRQKFDEDDDIAAVILDPAMFAGGLWPAEKSYLEALRKLTTERKIVLIFDEVISGFRIAAGGGQGHFGIKPDLMTFAKALSGGGTLSAVAGRADVMSGVVPNSATNVFNLKVPGTFQSGTTNDDTMSLASSIGALRAYKKLDDAGDYERLNNLTKRFSQGMVKKFHECGVPCYSNQWGPLLRFVLSDGEASFKAHQKVDKSALSLFIMALMTEGVLLSMPTSGATYLSFAHTEADIDTIIEKTELVLRKYKFAELY
ncbi:MAG: aminotransferase class III-fold pyridoxal phosphate-dependent enzyme [Rhodospirillaceae bacterium]|jgi:glutamate-1-semialdehyde 2,1-aminomutase|nr:aminotransferase class III-fold pyridoxal phosphate-dependent enzyme [Rhodospirillaceae bacterium]